MSRLLTDVADLVRYDDLLRHAEVKNRNRRKAELFLTFDFLPLGKFVGKYSDGNIFSSSNLFLDVLDPCFFRKCAQGKGSETKQAQIFASGSIKTPKIL